MDSKDDDVILCEVFGKCLRDYWDGVFLCSWDVISEYKDIVKDNQTRYVVIKSCIVKRKILR